MTAIANKTDRKKVVSTNVFGSTVTFHRAESGEEFARLDVRALPEGIVDQLLIYGAKQIVADVVAGVDGVDKKIDGMAAAVASQGSGVWPRRASAPATLEPAIGALMANMGITREKAREMLGLDAE